MEVFSNYARYYDLLYQDKNYQEEVDYVDSLIKEHSSITVNSILDLGCGTGKHDFFLAEKKYTVTGIDFAQGMIDIANKAKLSISDIKPVFILGDVRNINIEKQFDAIVSLFHVASYQTSNEDLENYFSTAKKHLKENGIFIFDCWYGPAVLTDKPKVRFKKLEDNLISVTRIAEPVLYSNKNVVDVNYTITIKNKNSGNFEEIKETHKMRYLFQTEIEFLAKQYGFILIHSEEWITRKNPGYNTWNVCFILKSV